MIEFILLFIIIILILLLFVYIMGAENILLVEKEREILRIEKMMKIAEKKFMKGKIKRAIFEDLQDDLYTEKINLELEISSIKKAGSMDVDLKTNVLMQRAIHPSRHNKLVVKKLIKEVDLLRDEMMSIERKFLKREIKDNVFRKLMKDKENKLIRKESQIIELVNDE